MRRLTTVWGGSSQNRVDEVVIQNIEEVLWRCMRQDDALGPQAALETTVAQRNLISLLVRECPERLMPKLLSVWSNVSRFAGWLSFDLGAFKDAEYYYQDAREKAHAAEDTALGVMVLCNLSHLAFWTKRPRVAIDHAVAAQGWARRVHDPLLRAYSSDVAARAYTLAGDRQLCLSELESAESDLNTSNRDIDPNSLAYFYSSGQFSSTKCSCLLDLGDPKAAVPHGEVSLRNIDLSFVRNRAITTLSLARALIDQGEIDEAAERMRGAAELVVRNRSVRAVTEFQSITRKLQEWPENPSVIAFRNFLAVGPIAAE